MLRRTTERNGFMVISLTAVEEAEYGMGVKDVIERTFRIFLRLICMGSMSNDFVPASFCAQ